MRSFVSFFLATAAIFGGGGDGSGSSSGLAHAAKLASEHTIPEMNAMAAALESMQPHQIETPKGAGKDFGKVYQHHVHPEGWEGKKATHIPTLVLKGDVAYVHVDHPMDDDHYINAIYVRADIHGRPAQTIFFKELTPENPKAVARFAVPDGVTQMKPYASCNKHGVWAGHRAMYDREL